ncbi:endonuclease/exonuclease/phosphatase family protein [Nocardioides sp. SYSU D00038]|uniref:endonuclease/exonuclease/phosphatase family protein n=1 Tax=Nocardioides sp. SYSU D00038 TaxID=2812554 RepID=UPI00196831EF|nr:endonuclease/exonuclease/phosphatase family protein [Nocardioides sp. SYSU D00038]
MRLATFNILSGRSPVDDVVDEQRFADAITALDADLLGLQEVDRNQPRSQHADLTAIAAEAMGAPHHLFVAALTGTPGATWSAATGEEQPDSAAYGVAFLSRHPVVGWQVVRLAPAPVPVPHRFHDQVLPEWVRDEPRVAVVAEVDTPAGRIDVVTTHLSFLRAWNGRQLRRLLRALPRSRRPRVLLGDLNMGRERAERITRMRPLATGPTFPAAGPEEQLDHILTDSSLTARHGGPQRLPMSDHLALVAEVS